jgi:hypothetical protein
VKKHSNSSYLAASCLAVVALGTVALAQAPAPPKPGPEHKALAYFVGNWTGEGEMKPGPLGPGGKITSTDSCQSFEGGFQVVCRGKGTGPMGPMTSLGVMAYSAADKGYTYYGIDNMGTSELSTGQKSGSSWTFGATTNFGGQTFKSRYTVVEVSPTSYTFKWETSADGTKWATLMEGKSTKAK